VTLLPLPYQGIIIRLHLQELGRSRRGPCSGSALPASLAQGRLAIPGSELSGPVVVIVDPAEAIATTEAPAPGAGQQGPQAGEVQSPPWVEQPDTLPREVTAKTTHTLTLEPRNLENETGTRTQDPRTLTPVKPRTLTLDLETRTLTLVP